MTLRLLFQTLVLSLLIGSCSGSQETSTTKEKEKEGESVSSKKEEKEKLELDQDKIDKVEKAVQEKVRDTSELFAFHKRTPCYGKCPVYTMRIFESRYAVLRSKHFIELEKGKYHAVIPEEHLQEIRKTAERIDFFDLRKKYDGNVTDLPSRITELHIGDKEHKVINRYDGPEELEDLEKLFGELLNKVKWKEMKD